MIIGVAIDTLLSVSMLVYLMRARESLTPDFFHFVVCLGEDACHTIWALLLWFGYKRFYEPEQPSNVHNSYSSAVYSSISANASLADGALPENLRLLVNAL